MPTGLGNFSIEGLSPGMKEILLRHVESGLSTEAWTTTGLVVGGTLLE